MIPTPAVTPLAGTALAVIGLVVVGGFVAGVAFRWRQEQRRRHGWASEAARLGLTYAAGDPLGLAGPLHVHHVNETVSGTVDGVRVAALTVSRIREHATTSAAPGREWITGSVGVALDVTRPDGGPVVVDGTPSGWHLTHSPVPAAGLEALLRATAAAGRSR